MNLCADRLLAVIEIEAIKQEIELLRDQYFYLPQHEDFNAFFYEYLEEVNRDGLSLEERLNISYKAFTKAIAYMNTFYPDHRMDVDLLSFDTDNPYYPEVLVKFPRKNFAPRRTTMKHSTKKQTNSKRKRGRPRQSEQ